MENAVSINLKCNWKRNFEKEIYKILTLFIVVMVQWFVVKDISHSISAILTTCPQDSDKQETFLYPYSEWCLQAPSLNGNPFDIEATATFVHEESGALHRTSFFYAGENVYKIRFTGTKIGKWSFHTKSKHSEFNAIRGQTIVKDNRFQKAIGFLIPYNGKFAQKFPLKNIKKTFIYNIYQNDFEWPRFGIGQYVSSDSEYLKAVLKPQFNELLKHGATVFPISVNNSWFKYGEPRYDKHQSINPDIKTFEILERIIILANQEGIHVRICAWGDEERKWTPIGVNEIKTFENIRGLEKIHYLVNKIFKTGGINGSPDKRLQRYIAARLGAIPGWSISYGFDLEEWVTEEQVGEWAGYLKEHMGWPHLLMARGRTHPNLDVRSISHYGGPEKLPKSYNDVVKDMQYDKTRPHIYEERFLHGRWDYFTMDVTIRHMWWYAMAGGMGGFWGVMWDDGPQYPNPEQMRTHKRFWDGRFLLNMERANSVTDGYALKTPDDSHLVFYREEAESITMDLSHIPHALLAVAVDAKKVYREVDLGMLDPGTHSISLPYLSDWAVAVGLF